MPKAYWIARIDVTDPETYKVYASGAAAAFQQYGATYLVRGGAFTAAEGQARSRNVVIEFHRIRRRSIATTPKNIRRLAPIASQPRPVKSLLSKASCLKNKKGIHGSDRRTDR